MTTAASLYRQHSKAALLQMQQGISDDPANKETGGGLFLYSAPARKKLSAVATAITMHIADERAAAGRPVPTCGYSGRQTGRRR